MHQKEESLQNTLMKLKLHLSVHAGKQLTYDELASIAGVGSRSFGEWMRGTTVPPGMLALLRLMSLLPQDELSSILSNWKQEEVKTLVSTTPPRKKRNGKTSRRSNSK